MLLGYDKDGEIKFYFTDDNYLKTYFPKNSAKISNFWKRANHGLKELFVDRFDDIVNVKLYKVINNKVVKKSNDEIGVVKKSCSVETKKVKVKKEKHKVEEVKLSKPKKTAQEAGDFKKNDSIDN